MILALLLLVGVPQAAPASDDEAEEIVVTASYGRTTMLFDKGSDGRLRNCRIMVSSGSQRLDAEACQATPVCYAPTADEVTDCVELGDVEALVRLPDLKAPPVRDVAPASAFEMPRLVQPAAPLPEGFAGPSAEVVEAPDTQRQRIEKLPPPPTAPSDLPAIRITNAQDQ